MPDTSNTSATHTQNEQQEWNTSETRATRLQHKCNMSAKRMTRVRHECYTNGTSENILYLITSRAKSYFHILYLLYGKSNITRSGTISFEVLPLEMLRSHSKMHLKSSPQKLDFVMVKAISKSYTVDGSSKFPCTFPHSYAKKCSLIFDKKHLM